jgi:hypothetical protein
MAELRPAAVCRSLLAALDASEGRRRGRKRNTTPDAIGIAVKRGLLEAAVRDDPEPEAFEGWLLEHTEMREGSGDVRAMAREVMSDWKLAHTSSAFRAWLQAGAPSDDSERRVASD